MEISIIGCQCFQFEQLLKRWLVNKLTEMLIYWNCLIVYFSTSCKWGFFFPVPIWQVLMKLHSDLILFNYLCLRTSYFTKLVFKEIAFFRTSSLFLCENSKIYCKITKHNMSLLLPFSMTPIIKQNWVFIQFSYICINMSPEGKVS